MALFPVVRNYFHILRPFGILLKGRRAYGQRVINKSGSDIAANTAVSISGYDSTSQLSQIVLADADAAGAATDVYVTAKIIKNGKAGDVWKGFKSTATLNTSGATNVGDPVYLSTTAGAFTSTEPTGTGVRDIILGYVQVKSSTVGQIVWDVQVKKWSTLDQNA